VSADQNMSAQRIAWDGRAADAPITPGVTPNPLEPIVEHAVHYATNNGWHVFPAPPGEKKSYYKATEANGQRKWGCTTDAAEIRHYWTERPKANVCIVTGADSGIFVVETDTAAHGDGVDGAASLAALEAEHGALPETLMAISPSGSIHRYFKHPGRYVINSESVIAPGVDVRGDGGMVVAPPSMMPAREATPATPAIEASEGKLARAAKKAKPARAAGVYRWLNDLPIADAPQWLLDRNVPAKTIRQRAVDGIKRPPGVFKGVNQQRAAATSTGGDNFWRRVKDSALADRTGWVQALFGNIAQLKTINGMQVWRMTSEDLGRDLEEDLSIAPNGIFDFGTEEALTAIDVVMRFSSPSKTDEEAALWLCEQIGIAPKDLGWNSGGTNYNPSDPLNFDNAKRIPEPSADDATPKQESQPGASGANESSSYGSTTPPPEGNGQQQTLPPLIVSSAGFLAGFVPPDYLIDGILQRRFCYSITAPTGTGKTAMALLFAVHVALGSKIGDIAVEKGRVLYLAGENPDDIRMRWLAAADKLGFNPDTIDVNFLPGVYKISEIGARIYAEVEKIGPVALVIVDTSAAYYEGDDENANVQMGVHARRMRALVTLPGQPAVLVCCHPVKNATADNMVPKGGGSFLNEVDGNLTCTKVDSVVTLHWQGKYRGPDFAPLPFQLHTVTTDKLKDSKGRPIPSVVATPLSDKERGEADARSRKDEDDVLLMIAGGDRRSQADIALLLNWTTKDGKPYRARVQRSAERLKKGKLIDLERGSYVLTTKGKKEADRLKEL
jgi:Bifunctional DNA primase/polymerase, N-terminal/AAA domain